MAITCTKRVPYNDQKYTGKCSVCKSEFEALRSDLSFSHHMNEECIQAIKCPECKSGHIYWDKMA